MMIIYTYMMCRKICDRIPCVVIYDHAHDHGPDLSYKIFYDHVRSHMIISDQVRSSIFQFCISVVLFSCSRLTQCNQMWSGHTHEHNIKNTFSAHYLLHNQSRVPCHHTHDAPFKVSVQRFFAYYA